MLMLTELLGPAPNDRAVISSLPDVVAVTVKVCVATPAAIVIRKSMYPAPLIVFDDDAFAVTRATNPDNVTVTACAFADAAGLFNDTRTTSVVPATYVPLPVWRVGAPVIVNNACALIAMPIMLVSGPNARAEISSVPRAVAVIVTDGWLDAPASIVTSMSRYPVPLIVFDTDAFAEMPVAPPNDKVAFTMSAFADVARLDSETRMVNDVPATYVPFPLKAVKVRIERVACALMLMLNAPLGPALNGRAVISSLPEAVAVIDSAWLAVPAAIVIKKSM